VDQRIQSATLDQRLGNDEAWIGLGLQVGAKLMLIYLSACEAELIFYGHHKLSVTGE